MACTACSEAKAKQKSVPKKSKHKEATTPNGRIYLDISTIKKPKHMKQVKHVYQPHWGILMDETTQLKFTEFFDTKSGMVEPTCELFQLWKQNGKEVKVVRCDNAGENLKLDNRLKSADWKLNVKFEYTARNTPQQNSLAEKAFDTLYSRGRAMMNAANIPKILRYSLFREAFKTATFLDGLTMIELNGITKT